MALPLDTVTGRLREIGSEFRVVPYGPPRAGAPPIADPAGWRVALLRADGAGVIEIVAVPMGAEATRLGGERGRPRE